MEILDCVTYAKDRKEYLKEEFKKLKEVRGYTPTLAIICTSDDPASEIYVNSKVKWCNELGVICYKINMNQHITDDQFINKIRELNRDTLVNGIIIQLPLSYNLSKDILDVAREVICPDKDIDGMTKENIALMYLNKLESIKPCTPSGIIDLLKYYNIDVANKDVCIIGRSELVGKPLAIMLEQANATVTLCHSWTMDLSEKIKRGDIVISAVGMPHSITGDMIKEGATVIDIGISRVDGKIYGDVNLESIKDKAKYATKTPSGTALCTLTALFHNLLECTERQLYDQD